MAGITETLGAITGAINTALAVRNAVNPPSAGISWSDVEKNEALMGAQWRENQRIYDMQRENYLADLADERQYNSAKEQVQRLRDAGINPAFAFGQGSSSGSASAPSAGSVVGGSAPSNMQAQVNSDAWNRMADVIGGSVSSFYDNIIKKEAARKANADADVAEVQASTIALMKREELEKMRADRHLTDKQREEIDQRLRWIDSTWDENKRQLMLGTRSLEAQNDLFLKQGQLLDAQKQALDLENRAFPLKMELNKKSVEAAILSARASAVSANAAASQAATAAEAQKQSAKESDWRIGKIATEILDQIETTDGKKLDNNQKRALSPYVNDIAHETYESMLLDNESKRSDLNNPVKYFSPIVTKIGK